MAYFHVLEEVRTFDPGDWQLCFQYGVYVYEPADSDSREFGYRFIWRRPNGQLQGARGQARLEPELITILLGKAAEAGWYPTPPHTRGRSFKVDATLFKVSIQVPVTGRWVAEGDYLPEPQEAGLRFSSSEGDFFLPLDYPELPSAVDLALASHDQLHAWLARARAATGTRM